MTVFPCRSISASAGATLLVSLPYHQRRITQMRPLMVSIVLICRPLLARRLPVLGWCGGGKSGFRRVHAHLDGSFKSLAAELST